MSEVEINSREDILFENYAKIVNIEALTMIEMASRDIIPAVNAYMAELADTAAAKLAVMPDICCEVEKDILRKLSELNASAYKNLNALKSAEKEAAALTDNIARAEAYRNFVLPAMAALRRDVDAMEELTASEYWPLPTYGDIMFRI